MSDFRYMCLKESERLDGEKELVFKGGKVEQVYQLKRIADSFQELVRLARTTGVKTK